MATYSSCNAGSMLRVVVILLQCFVVVANCFVFSPIGCNHRRKGSIDVTHNFIDFPKKSTALSPQYFLRDGMAKLNLARSLQSRKSIRINIPYGVRHIARNHNYNAWRNDHHFDFSLSCHGVCQSYRWRKSFRLTVAKWQKRLTAKIVSVKNTLRLKIFSPVVLATVCFFSLMIMACPSATLAADSAAAAKVVLRRSSLWKSAESAFRILYAAALGSVLGLERTTSSQKAGAGVRTMALVSLGACVFGMCGTHGFAARLQEEVAKFHPSPSSVMITEAVDASRMASGVATGVGFLGAGIISNNRRPDGTYDKDSSVRALATAAAIWVSSAIGVSAGAGLYSFAFVMTLLTVVTLRMGEYMNPPDSPTSSSSGKMTRSSPSSSLSSKSRQDIQAPESTSTQSVEEKLWRVKVDAKGSINAGPSLPVYDATIREPVDKIVATTSTAVTSKASKAVDPLLERVWKREGALLSQENAGERQAGTDNKSQLPPPSGTYLSRNEDFQPYEVMQENRAIEALSKENNDESEFRDEE